VPTVAILPVKSFRLGKGRMAEHLSVEERSDLGQRLTERTATLAIDAGMVPVLVAGDGDVAAWALRLGMPSIPDPGQGLSTAAESGVQWANASNSPWMVVHVDLPLLRLGELEEAVALLGEAGFVIAPSADGGTSALGGHGPATFSYGPGSFQAHLARFPGARVITRLGLLHDVDSLADLISARRHPRGLWLDQPR
jgi:2-phospho-L-lactate guanylyltransferase